MKTEHLIFLILIIGFVVLISYFITEDDKLIQVVTNYSDNVSVDKIINNNKWDLPITYKIIEIKTGEFSSYKCFDNEINRIDKAFSNLNKLTDGALIFEKIENQDINTSITFSCLGRNFNSAFYETIGEAEFNGYNNPSFIIFFNQNDPYRNCLDLEYHEILHLFGFNDTYDGGFNKNMSIMEGSTNAQCIEIDQWIIDKLKEDYS